MRIWVCDRCLHNYKNVYYVARLASGKCEKCNEHVDANQLHMVDTSEVKVEIM